MIRNKDMINNSRKQFFIAALIVILFGSGVFFGFLFSSKNGVSASPDPHKWQAVFLNNGQVYFGRLLNTRNEYVLTNVYYLRASQSLQPSVTPAPSFELVRLGGELHGPEDAVYFEKSSVLFWENLKADFQVVQAINNFQKN